MTYDNIEATMLILLPVNLSSCSFQRRHLHLCFVQNSGKLTQKMCEHKHRVYLPNNQHSKSSTVAMLWVLLCILKQGTEQFNVKLKSSPTSYLSTTHHGAKHVRCT